MRQIQIRFIFKKQTEAQRMDPMNYRPISLLNTDYKILSKALANRLTPCLDDLLDDVQHCIPGMCISDPIRTVQSIIHQCKSLKQPGAIMLCDFEKAFDSVSHDYVKELMHAMNISKKNNNDQYEGFIRWTSLAFTETKAQCIINESISIKNPTNVLGFFLSPYPS